MLIRIDYSKLYLEEINENEFNEFPEIKGIIRNKNLINPIKIKLNCNERLEEIIYYYYFKENLSIINSIFNIIIRK